MSRQHPSRPRLEVVSTLVRIYSLLLGFRFDLCRDLLEDALIEPEYRVRQGAQPLTPWEASTCMPG